MRRINEAHRQDRGDPRLEARIQSFELAFRMQMEAADAFDVKQEPAHIRAMYGEGVHGRQTPRQARGRGARNTRAPPRPIAHPSPPSSAPHAPQLGLRRVRAGWRHGRGAGELKGKGGREGNARSLPHPLLTRRPPTSSLSP